MTYLYEHSPGRWVEVEVTYTCQRWPEGTTPIARDSRREVVVRGTEQQGFWLGWTGKNDAGERIERYMVINLYRVRVPHLHEDRLIVENELREP